MRNTAAAIGLAASLIAARDPQAVMVVLPADHAIRPTITFVNTFRAAIHRAEDRHVVGPLVVSERRSLRTARCDIEN